jgi:hypothetical protein
MNRYIATFHTHFAALCTCRALSKAGIPAELSPVPRALSADCGSCVRFAADTPCRALMHADFDRVVLVEGERAYTTVVKNDAP